LGIAALEDKIVQQAVVTVLNQIYEADFKGFSYGFRPGVTGNCMVLVVALHNLPKPCAHLTRTMMLTVLKLRLDSFQLRNHPLLRRNAPDVKGSAAREISTKMRESQKREGLGFSLATLLPVVARIRR
jgi:hypothetical protein